MTALFFLHKNKIKKEVSSLQINDVVCEKMEHDAVIETLKSAGQTVYLTVRYFKPAALFLKRGNIQFFY